MMTDRSNSKEQRGGIHGCADEFSPASLQIMDVLTLTLNICLIVNMFLYCCVYIDVKGDMKADSHMGTGYASHSVR